MGYIDEEAIMCEMAVCRIPCRRGYLYYIFCKGTGKMHEGRDGSDNEQIRRAVSNVQVK